MIWLFLFGSLFRKVVELPGFGTASPPGCTLVPGVVIMSALVGQQWPSGMTVLGGDRPGHLDRFLVLPLHRSRHHQCSAVMQALIIAVQSIIIGLLGWVGRRALLGAASPGWWC